MSTINSILSTLLRGTSSSSSTKSSSTINGVGSGATFGADTAEVGSGIDSANRAFTDSYVRLNDAVSAVSVTQNALEKLDDLASDMLELAKLAHDQDVVESQRLRLNNLYQKKVDEFRAALETAQVESADFLAHSDVATFLESAGIDVTATTELAERFSKLAGSDDLLGYETFAIEEQTVDGETALGQIGDGDPLETNLKTRADAAVALTAVGKMQKLIEKDRSGIQTVLEELESAAQISRAGAIATEDSFDFEGLSVDEVVDTVVSRIRSITRDSSLNAHGTLDRKLVEELLADAS